MSRLEPERERALLAALHALARDLEEPPFDPERERALLAIFDETRARPAAKRQVPVWTSLAAAALLLATALTWRFTGAPGVPGIAMPGTAIVVPDAQQAQAVDPGLPIASGGGPLAPLTDVQARADVQSPLSSAATDFVAWPGTAAWPPFESGELIRVALPIDGGFIEADVIVGQDGFARAVRFIQ